MNSILSPVSLTSFYDAAEGTPIHANLRFYTAGSLDPITVYKDAGLSVPWSQPVEVTGSFRVPPVFVGEIGTYRVRVTDGFTGVLIEDIDNLPSAAADPGSVPPPVAVDTNALLKTGDIIAAFNASNPRTGFVRCNGLTIGSAASAATERANADTENLFKLLWAQDAIGGNATLAVSGGRGASAASDWAANKTIALPDLRGRAMVGMESMGNVSSGRITGVVWTGSVSYPGAYGGAQTHTLDLTQIPFHNHGFSDPGHAHSVNDPAHSHGGTTGLMSQNHTHTYGGPYKATTLSTGGVHNAILGSGSGGISGTSAIGTTDTAAQDHTHSITTTAQYTGISIYGATTGISFSGQGGGLAHNNVQPSISMMFYMKL